MKLAEAIVAELRKLPEGEAATRMALRAAIGCSPAELTAAIQRLRYQGKLVWDRLELAASQRVALAPEGPHPAGPGPAVPLPKVGEGRDTASQMIEADAGVGLGAANKDEPASSEHDLAAAPRPSGAELAAEIRAYCRAQAIGTNDFSMAAVGYSSLMGNILRSHRPLPRVVAMVRDFIAAHPDGLPVKLEPVQSARAAVVRAPLQPAPRPSLADVVRAEAEGAVARRRTASIVGGSGTPLSPATRPAVEAIQSEAVATPGDLMIAIQRRHPQLMRRAIDLSRAHGVTPAAALYSALEAGLSHVEQERAHG